MAKIVIYGAGTIAKLAHYYFTHDSEHDVVAFAVDEEYKRNDRYLDLPLIDARDFIELYPPQTHKMFIALSYSRMNKDRAEKYHHAIESGYELVSYISSRCCFLTENPVGDNCFILEGSTIQPFVRIGNNITLWSGNHIAHDSIVDDHCFLGPNVVVSGYVHIGSYCFLGLNATVRNGITLAPETFVGAGAVITRDTEPRSVYVPPRTKRIDKMSDEMKV